MDDFLPQLLEAWHSNNHINLLLIDHIGDEGMKCSLSKRGGRNVVRQFAHMHNARQWHLEARASDLGKGLATFATHDEPAKDELKAAFNASAEALATFFTRCVTGEGKARPFKKGVISTFAYFVSHEAHHRGNILLTLKQCGHKIDAQVAWAIWDWEKL